MATFGTGAGAGASAGSTSVAITPPADATILVGGIAINYFVDPTITMTWDGGATTEVAGAIRTDSDDEICVLRYVVNPGTTEANLVGGGGAASDDLHLAGIGVAGTETTDPVRDSISGEATGGADISWTPTGLQAGDAMFIMATVFAAGGGQSLAAGAGTSSAYLDSNPGSFTQAAIFAYKNATSSSDTIDVTSGAGTVQYVGLCIKGASAGGGQEDVTAEFDFGSTLSGIASVNFPANAELTSSTFNVSGQADSQGSGQEDIEATLEADFDVIDGDSLNIYVAGFSTLSSGFQVEGTTANEDVENIDGTLTWSSQVNDLRVETLLENSGELSAGFQLENSSTILQLNASLNFQASLTGSTGLGKNPNEVIRTGTDFIDTGIDYVKNFDNQIVKTY